MGHVPGHVLAAARKQVPLCRSLRADSSHEWDGVLGLFCGRGRALSRFGLLMRENPRGNTRPALLFSNAILPVRAARAHGKARESH